MISLFIAHPSFAQSSSTAQQSQMGSMDQRNPTTMMQHMQEMDKMAKSMTSMADTCRMMMEREMKNYSLKMVALTILGILIAIALVLFVVLEILWIRFWSIRNKTEQMKLK